MPDLNIHALRAFLTIVEERGTTKAAVRLGISTSGLVNRLQRLERAFGTPLLERRFPPDKDETGRTQLTPHGLVMLPRVIGVVRAYDALFGEPPLDRRELNRILAAGLMELAVKALRHDLSDQDIEHVESILRR